MVDSHPPRHVVFVVAEMAPLVKVGGLADVAGSLPGALAARGLRVTVILPFYRSIDRSRYGVRPLMDGLRIEHRGSDWGFAVREADAPAPGVRLLLVEREDLFGRDGVYVDPVTKEEYPDTGSRFTLFTRAAIETLRALGDRVDVLHCHDHQTALGPALLRMYHGEDPVLGGAASVYTLHNLGYQGIYPVDLLDDAGIGREHFFPGSWFEYFSSVNCMKAGICFADKVSTVSETYAREICRDPVQSAGLAPVLQSRSSDLVGIVNGIDPEEWNPATDPHIAASYDAKDTSGKKACKRALLEEVGLDADVETPLIGMVTRLVDQKGLDLVQGVFDRLLEEKVRFVVLGTGIPKYEAFFEEAARRYPGRVASLITFNNAMAHKIEAGADMFLMPSLYEPCGLNQLYSLRYGTVPVVRATGGLADTVLDADESAEGTGFSFFDYSMGALRECTVRAIRAYADPARWQAIVRRGMLRDLSWNVSAGRYIDLYEEAIVARQRR